MVIGGIDMKNKKQVIYYNEHGKIDRFTTFINNNDWLFIPVFILAIFLGGLFD